MKLADLGPRFAAAAKARLTRIGFVTDPAAGS